MAEQTVANEVGEMLNTLQGLPNPDSEPVQLELPLGNEPPPQSAPEPVQEARPDMTPPSTPVSSAPAELPVPAEGEPAQPVEPPTVSTEDLLRQEIARLGGMLAAKGITGDVPQAFPTPVPTPVPSSTPVQTPVPVVPQQVSSINALEALLGGEFLNQDELDAVIDKPELLNAAYKRQSEQLIRNLTQVLPAIVQASVTKEIQVNKLVTTFYEMHSDLRPYADYVRLVMGEVESQNPQKTYRELFEDTAKQCRQRLGLKEATVPGQTAQLTGKPLPPAFAGSKNTAGRPSGTPTTKPLFDDNAADLLNLKEW